MKALFINSPSKERPVARDMAGGFGFDGGQAVLLPPLELAYMAATLIEKGHQARIIDADAEGYDARDVYRIAGEYKPDAVIATLSLPTIDKDCLFLKGMRDHIQARMIAKTGITYAPILKEVLAKSSADMCIYGECDMTIDRIIEGTERAGTAYMKDGQFVMEKNTPLEDMDRLPLPARELLPNGKYRYILLGNGVTTMQTSRGCPFACSYYCPYPLVQGSAWRSRSPGHVIKEIADIVEKHHIRKILFRDATFTFDRKRAMRICELIIEKRLDIAWWCETRVDRLDEELMRMMKKAGCMGMNIGVETGDPALMESQAKIGLTLDKLKDIRRSAKALGLKLHFLLMIGLPGDTRESLYKTFNLVLELGPESLGICIITPYPGTPLYSQAKEKGWIETEDWEKFGGHTPVMHTDDLSGPDLLEAKRMIEEGAYLAKKGILGRLKLASLTRRFKKWAEYPGRER